MAFGRSIIENLRRRLKTVRAADLVIKFLVGLKGRTDYRRMTKRGWYSSASYRFGGERVNQHLRNRIKGSRNGLIQGNSTG